MTILIILALFVLAVVFAVFFLIFKVGWLIFKKHTYAGPLIAAGVCTVLVTLLVGIGTYKGYQAIVSPFQGMIARVKNNSAPLYGPREYADTTYPFTLTVYDGMDFSDWIRVADVELKLGIDTNAFKKDAAGKSPDNALLAVIVRQPKASANTFDPLKQQLQEAQRQRRLELKDEQTTTIHGLPAYQASGEAYTNRGKANFWLTAVQTPQQTVYYIGAMALQDSEAIQTQAQALTHSFSFTQS